MGGSGRGVAAGIVLALALFAAFVLLGARLGPEDAVFAAPPARPAPAPAISARPAPAVSPAPPAADAPAAASRPATAARAGTPPPVAEIASAPASRDDPARAAPSMTDAAPLPPAPLRTGAASAPTPAPAAPPLGGAPIAAAPDAPRVEPPETPRPAPTVAAASTAPAASTPIAAPASAPVAAARGDAATAAGGSPTDASAAAAPGGDPAGPAPPPAATTSEVAPLAAAAGPAIDLVRVDRDGRAQIAGRAGRGAEVVLRAEGVEIARVPAGPGGAFAALVSLGPSARPRAIELSEAGRPGARTIIVQPSPPERPDAAPAPNPPRAAPPAPDPARPAAAAAPPVPTAPVDRPAAPASSAPPAAAASPKVVVAGADGVRVVQAPPLTRGVEIDTIAYGAGGQVRLAGRAPPGRAEAVRVYLDGAPVLEAPMAPDGAWSGALSGIAAGDYTLRVDSLGAEGDVLARTQTPFRRETPAIVAGAGSSVVTVQPGFTLWAIAEDRYGSGISYVRVFEANRDRIRDPDLIYPGQIFDVPAAD